MKVDKSQRLQVSQQTGDPGEQTVRFQSEPEGTRTRIADVSAPVQRLAQMFIDVK